ncbi:MAG: PAS domain-containing protein [Pseudomonadota bacterium]
MTISTNRLADVFEHLNIAISISDPGKPDCPLIYVNAAFEAMTLYGRDDVIDTNCRFLQGAFRHQKELENLRPALKLADRATAVLRNFRKDGSEFNNFLILMPVLSDASVPLILGCQFNFAFDQDRVDFINHTRSLGYALSAYDNATYTTLKATTAAYQTCSDSMFNRLMAYGWTGDDANSSREGID